jgi:tetratricopeptide (TPR) repeat protein
MTTETTVGPGKRFVTSVLPWIIAGAALLVYVLTLNPWVNFNSLSTTSRIAGLTWQPTLTAPIFWLVTLPFSVLPASVVPIALNLFSAICAALVLWLLARSVSLLPHDRTQEQRDREYRGSALFSARMAWFPPVAAALVCGLQLTFWESATAISGEMFDLLLFAYVIRCLLEYRLDESESWLLRCSLVYGAGMANNWAMIAFFPIFLAAVIRLKGMQFFRARFLGRMFVAGAVGLSIYLLLPLVAWIQGVNEVGFWPALKFNLQNQKALLMSLPFNKQALFAPDFPLWVFGISSLVPLLMMSIKWPSHFGDHSRLGVTLTTWILHLFHGVLLVYCAWISLDPMLSPRYHHPGLFPSGFLLLPFYFLGALGVGYFSAYFLLIFGVKPPSRIARMMRHYPVWIKQPVLALVYALAIFATALLLCRNLPQVLASNSSIYRDFVRTLTADLPKGALLLSDDPRYAAMVQLAANTTPDAKHLTLDTTALKWPDYHAFVAKQYPGHWTNLVGFPRLQPLDDLVALGLINRVQRTNAVFYLHPSFGYFFETSYPESRGLTYLLTRYSTNSIFPPALTPEVIDKNEKFWTEADAGVLAKLAAKTTPHRGNPRILRSIADFLRLPDPPNHDAVALAAYYSRARVCWGVELQRNGKLKAAAASLERALEINPENVVAQIDLQSNQDLQAERKPNVQITKTIEDQFGKYRSWEQVMTFNGPFDEPTFCYEQGRVFVRGNLFRQAAHQFSRVTELAPDHLPARLWLGQTYLRLGRPDESLRLVSEIKAQPGKFGLSQSNIFEVVMLEATTYLSQTNPAAAAETIRATLRQYPKDEDTLAAGVQAFMNAGDYSNAVTFIDQQLAQRPDHPNALLNKGFALLQIGAYSNAIPSLNQLIEMKGAIPNEVYFSALLNRAICHFKLSAWDASEADYAAIATAYPTEFRAHFGLGEIALRKNDTNGAIQSFERYLSNAPPTAEAVEVTKKLKALRPANR